MSSDTPPENLAAGRYTLVAPIGEGGMATVYRGYDHRLKVWRAIKLLSTEYGKRARLRQRFESEAQTMALLEHPHIVRVYDLGVEGNHPFIVMELCESGSVVDWLDRWGPMPERLAAQVLIQSCAGITAAHAKGVIHRDVKPHNILVAADGICKMSDFGIARLTDQAEAMPAMTRTGAVIGTLGYMAPEQRNNAKAVDTRADVYALGASLFTLLTNRTTLELFAAAQDDSLLEGVHPALVPVILKASAYRREDRYASAEALGTAIRDVFSRLPTLDPRSPPLTRNSAPHTAPQPAAPPAPAAAAAPPPPARPAPLRQGALASIPPALTHPPRSAGVSGRDPGPGFEAPSPGEADRVTRAAPRIAGRDERGQALADRLAPEPGPAGPKSIVPDWARGVASRAVAALQGTPQPAARAPAPVKTPPPSPPPERPAPPRPPVPDPSATPRSPPGALRGGIAPTVPSETTFATEESYALPLDPAARSIETRPASRRPAAAPDAPRLEPPRFDTPRPVAPRVDAQATAPTPTTVAPRAVTPRPPDPAPRAPDATPASGRRQFSPPAPLAEPAYRPPIITVPPSIAPDDGFESPEEDLTQDYEISQFEAAALFVHYDCKPKRSFGGGRTLEGCFQLLKMLRLRENLFRMTELARTEGVQARKVYGVFTGADGTFEATADAITVEIAPLAKRADECAGCPARIRPEAYGCMTWLPWPISASAEGWLINRLEPGDRVGGMLALQTLERHKYTGKPIAALRARGRFELKTPLVRTIRRSWLSSVQVDTDQLFHAVLIGAAGGQEPNLCLGLLLWLGAVQVDGVSPRDLTVDSIDKAIAMFTPDERMARTRLLLGARSDDPGVQTMQRLLHIVYLSWVHGVKMLAEI